MLVGDLLARTGRLSLNSHLGAGTAPLLFFLLWALVLKPNPSAAVYPKALMQL